MSQDFAGAGGSDTVYVRANAICPWMAASNVPWITITSVFSGIPNGSVSYTVAPNSSQTLRIGTITIAGQTFTVTQAATGLQFYPLASPIRLLDTRAGVSACDAPGVPISGGTSRNQTVAGRTCSGISIPPNAAAITGNITTVQSGGGYLTLYPSDAQQPLVANTNYGANEVINNVFTVGLGAGDGAFKIFALNTTDVVVDVTGYYAPPGAGGLYFHPLPTPVRLLETRAGQPVGCFRPGAPLSGGVDTLQQASGTCDIPAAARAIVGNATTVGPVSVGYLTLFPANVSRPLVASSNYNANQVVNAPVTVGLSPTGQFNIFTLATTDLVIDVLGYYSTQANDANGAGLLFNPLPVPVRLLDTRAGEVACYMPNAPMSGGVSYTQQAQSTCATTPNTSLAIVGNATVVNTTTVGYLTFWPSNAQRPLVATSNYLTGQVSNRHFTVGLGPDGAFKRFALATTDLVIDVSGYFAP